jgi:hypothetical protein
MTGSNPQESTYTMADHAREPRKYPACSCGAVWHQRGNVTGHCTVCHRTFEGVRLFDQHQSQDEGGRTVCADPTTTKIGGAKCRLVDGAWRGAAMPDGLAEKLTRSV